jgi:hypothetical protein
VSGCQNEVPKGVVIGAADVSHSLRDLRSTQTEVSTATLSATDYYKLGQRKDMHGVILVKTSKNLRGLHLVADSDQYIFVDPVNTLHVAVDRLALVVLWQIVDFGLVIVKLHDVDIPHIIAIVSQLLADPILAVFWCENRDSAQSDIQRNDRVVGEVGRCWNLGGA